MSPTYGERPPWHDVQLELRGPVVGALDTTFRERWNDPTPLDSREPDGLPARPAARRRPDAPTRCPPQPPDPPPCGAARSAGAAHLPGGAAARTRSPRTASAPSPAATPRRSAGPAGSIYLEDQYLWSTEVARLFARRAARPTRTCTWSPSCRATPTSTAGSRCRPTWWAGSRRCALCRKAGGDRVHVFDVENHAGTPVYVHAKVCVVDDVWASVGSDNFNRRSWTHDSELSCAVLDETPRRAGAARPRRARRRRPGLRPRPAAAAVARAPRPRGRRRRRDLRRPGDRRTRRSLAAADALEDWHRGGRSGPRPPGRLRPHRPGAARPADPASGRVPAYRLIYDPDGRPIRSRLKGLF